MSIRRIGTTWLACCVLALGACGPTGPGNGEQLDDDDGDTIANIHEGKNAEIDTDGDGTPDYLDLDSDGDGIPDRDEAGDDDTNTEPVDTDGDDTPDFRDLDSDGNGRLDADDGTDDIDGDGVGNWQDTDDDGDAISDLTEIGPDAASPRDTDGDGTFDFQDIDSDGDTIADAHEGTIDADGDGIPSYRDTTSDADCIADRDEAGDADVATPPIDSDGDGVPNFLDLDSDNDGLADDAEDANCNGQLDPGETSAIDDDTDGDGAPDPVEETAGTDPNNPADNPQANGDFVFIVPFQVNPEPASDDLDFTTNIQQLDVYVLMDRSGSMTGEITTVRANFQTALLNITCPPLGNGDPDDCIPDVMSGSGTVGYAGGGGQPYQNHVSIQPNPALPGPAIPTNEPNGCCREPLLLGIQSTVTGQGSVAAGCGSDITDDYPNFPSCPTFPDGTTGVGAACFRPNSIKAILLATDESPRNLNGNSGGPLVCPAANTVVTAANQIGAKILGIKGDSFEDPQVTSDLNFLATSTGAVDSTNGNAPLVFSGINANAAAAIEAGLRTLANGVPLDIAAVANDDTSDEVDAVAAFVSRLETLQLGSPECESGLTTQDTNGDGSPDVFINVTPGTGVCWRLFAKMNTTVPAQPVPQLFRATVTVTGDNSPLDDRDVFFFVPAVIDNGPID